MTVPSTTSRDQQMGDGASTVFTVPFRILDQTHMRVLIGDVEQALTTHYAVSNVGAANTTITFVSPPASLAVITFLRNVPLTQETDYVPNDPFPAESHERALDKLTMIAQQHDEEIARSMTLPAEVSGVATELPTPVDGNLIGWDTPATQLRNYSRADLATIVAYANKLYEIFTGTGAQTDFTLLQDPASLGNLEISIDGVMQVPGIDFSFAGTTLTFAAAPGPGATILVRYDQALPTGVTVADAVAYDAPGSGIVRTVADELDDLWVPITRFGALVDGVTDDTNAVNATIAFVGAAGGGTVYFPPGTCMVKYQGATLLGADREIAITIQHNNVHLCGAGVGASIIKQIPGSIRAHVVKFATRVGVLNPVTDCSIRHLTIDGSNTTLTSPLPTPDEKNGDCINVSTNSQRVVIEHVHCKNAGHYGIGMQRDGFKDCHIRNVSIEDCNGDGIDWKIDTNSTTRGCSVQNVRVLRFGLNTALSPQAGIDVRQGIKVSGCYVGEFSGDEAGLRVQLGTNDLITTVPIERSVVEATTCISAAVGTGTIGFQSSVNGVKFTGCHAAGAKWNWRVRASLCAFDDCSAVGGEIGWHVSGDANGQPIGNLLANIFARSGSVGGVVLDQTGGFPPQNNTFVNVHAEGNAGDTANFTIAATISGTRLVCGKISAGYVDNGTDSFAVMVQGMITEFRAGRMLTQYLRMHGDASGNYLTGVSQAGTPKNLQIIADANSGDLQLLALAGGANVRFGTFTVNADAPITGYITIKDDAGGVRKLAVIA